MRLIDIMMYNFMPYKGEHRISFPRDAQHNVMLIYGDNMRGKTCFLNAIRWVLYGRVLGRHLKEVDLTHIVNIDAAQEGDWKTAVHLRFEADGNDYDLRREMKLRELVVSPRGNNAFEVDVWLRKNGNPLRSDQISHEMNQLLPEQISRFFLFDGELLQEYEMLLVEESEQGDLIKDAIERVLGVPALINGRDQAKALLKRAQTMQANESRHIAGLQAQANLQLELENELVVLERDRANLGQKISEIQIEVDSLDDELKNTEAAQRHQAELDAQISVRDKLYIEQKELAAEKLDVLGNAWKDLIQPRLQVKINSSEKTISSLRDRIEHRGALRDQVKRLTSLLENSVCPTCEQSISSDQRTKFGAALGSLDVEIASVNVDMDKLNTASSQILQMAKIRPTGAAERLEAIEKRLRQISVSLTKAESEIENLREKIRGFDAPDIARKRSMRDKHIANMGQFREDLRRVEEKIAETTRKQKDIAVMLSKNPEARIQKGTRLVSAYTALEYIFSNGIEELRQSLRTKVGDLATSAFKELTTEPTYSALNINENYGLAIVDGEGRAVVERSAGAEQIVALSLIDGLNRTAGKRGPIVMDTPFGRLDPKHRNKVLGYLPKMADQVILLVHEGEIRKEVDLEAINDRIGSVFQIDRISSSQSRIVQTHN